MDEKNEQIFYDTNHRRWKYSRRTAVAVAAFLLAAFGVAVGGIIVRPALPQTNLALPDLGFRSVPNVPPNANTANKQTVPAGQLAPAAIQGGDSQPLSNASRRMIGFYVDWDDNSLTSLKSNIMNIDELMPEWLHLDATAGNVVVDDQLRQDQTMEFIRSARPTLPVVLLLNNYNPDTQDWDSGRLSAVLSDPGARTTLVQNLRDRIQNGGFSGIDIDFENIPDAQQQNLVLLMKELYETFHPLGLEVSESVPIDDNSFDTKSLSQYADFLIMMAYDQNSDGTLAGPVASQTWITQSLATQLASIPAQKIVMGVGGYGYDWEDGATDAGDVTYQSAMGLAKDASATVTFDKTSSNPTFSYTDDQAIVHHVWFLDAVTAYNEMLASNRLGNIRGYALWRMGSEDPSMWNVFNHANMLDLDTLNMLGTLDYGYDVAYRGSGEVLRVTAVPQVGQRKMVYNPTTGLIIDETIASFPSPYVITRWGGYDDKKLAITFDDGPDPTYTPEILDILKKYGVHATFFVIGVNANGNQTILRRIVNEGNEIGNHTYTHPNISTISPEQLNVELDATERLFEGVLGRKSLLFRPPYSEDIAPTTPDQVQPLVETNAFGYYTVGINIDPSDWMKPGTDAIVSSVVSDAENGMGSVILMHDAGGDRSQTVAALPKIIERLQAEGFQFVTVSDLVGLGRDDVMPKITVREQAAARLTGAAFTTLYLFNSFMYMMFFIGIMLGVARFLFVTVLAFAQWFHSRRGLFQALARDYHPSVDVIIPAYNEEKVICKTIQSILRSTYENYRIYVVNDGSQDSTFAQAYACVSDQPHEHYRVRIVTQENSGKAAALNFGIAQSLGDIIVTLDADTVFKPDTIEKLVRRFVDTRVGAVAGNAKVGNRINILTRWQALEYITSQNLDRRAFEIINCITVVPGAVGAWRRSALEEAGGFSNSTLAEDADLTFAIIRKGWQVAYEDEAIGLTEAPDTVKNFLKQRFRWMYGMLQTAWKHRDTLGKPRYGALGFFSVPNVLVFQIFFPLISPLMDLMLIFTIFWTLLQQRSHQVDFSVTQNFHRVIAFYLFFLLVDMLTAAIPFLLERKEQWSLLFWMPLQRFFYRQLMYYVAIKAVLVALKGAVVGWNKFERKATVIVEPAR